MIWRISTLIAALQLFAGVAAQACESLTFDGAPFTICEARPAEQDIRLFLRDEAGEIHGSFGSINAALARDDKTLIFAMNGGMYHPDRRPVGHYVEAGEEKMRVIAHAGPGNFGMLPNGILCITATQARVIETLRYLDSPPACDHATQSGPMLVIDGALHPRFLPDSTSRYIRNGVGSSADGQRLVFAISDRPVTFHHFARLFRDHLELPNALFLDGNVSRLYDARTGRADFGRVMGPVLGVVGAAK